MDSVTVYYDNQSMLVCKEVCDELGLPPNYYIRTEAEFWCIHEQNSAMMLTKCKIEQAKQKSVL